MNDLNIRQLAPNEPVPYELLLSADPSIEVIEKYLHQSDIYVAMLGSQLVGVYAFYPINTNETEIKNIAVADEHQGRGIGEKLLQHAIRQAKERGFTKLLIGTSNASVGQLYLYQRQGFEICGIRYDFFTDNYPEPIIENGIQCRHMIMLCKELEL